MTRRWTDEQISTLHDWRDEGLSFGMIANRVRLRWGERVSRNVIAGIFHRFPARPALTKKKPRKHHAPNQSPICKMDPDVRAGVERRAAEARAILAEMDRRRGLRP